VTRPQSRSWRASPSTWRSVTDSLFQGHPGACRGGPRCIDGGLTAREIVRHYPTIDVNDVRAAAYGAGRQSRRFTRCRWARDTKLDEIITAAAKRLLAEFGHDCEIFLDEGVTEAEDTDVLNAVAESTGSCSR
jgi:hypothetical protein